MFFPCIILIFVESEVRLSAQVLKAVPLADKGAFVTKISYSPLLGGYAIVLNDGRAAFLVASSNNFDPNVSTEIDDLLMISISDGLKHRKFTYVATFLVSSSSSHGKVK